MYQIDVVSIRSANARSTRARLAIWSAVSRTVWLLGATSLFTDISSEMVSSVLPAYLVLYLHLSPLQFGFIDGLYHGVTALVRIAGGVISDRWNRHKTVAIAGYGLSALCKPALILAGGVWSALAGVIVLDRTGKGIRTAPRDALISLSTPSEQLGTAFGVHRAMDACGAMLGPLAAFFLLVSVHDGFDAVFIISFCVALVGLSVLALFVPEAEVVRQENAPRPSFGSTFALLADVRLRTLTIVGSLLGLVTISDGFLYLQLQQRSGMGASMVPLLFVGTSLAYLLLAVPAGRLADRFGRGRVFLAGHVLAAAVCGLLFLPTVSMASIAVTLALFGGYYAATDGVLVAMASAIVDPAQRTSGLALLTTATSLSRLVSSVVFGALWMWFGPSSATGLFGCALIGGALTGAFVLKRVESQSSDASKLL